MQNIEIMKESKEIKFSIWRQRIGYGSSDFACNLIWQMISLYLLIYYTDVAGLSPAACSLIFLITRLIDGVVDVLVGIAIDKTNTRWGKSRPYILFGAIPFAVFAALAFSVPDTSDTGKFIYAFITYLFLSIAYSIVNVPMASILPALSSDPNERTALASTRMIFSFIGATTVSYFGLRMIDFFGQGNQATGYRIVMTIFGVLGCLIFFFMFFNTREVVSVAPQEKVSIIATIKSLSKNKPWIIFGTNILFMWTAYFLQSGALIYYFTYFVGSKEMAATVATIMAALPVISNFFVTPISIKIGKRNLFSVSSAVQLIGIFIIFIGGTNSTIIITGVIINALFFGLKQGIYFSMQADPIDYGEWKTGINAAGTLSAVNGFLGKVAMAVAGALSGALLSYSGYVANSEQTHTALIAIQAMYIWIPAVLIVGSIITMCFYDLDKTYSQIRKELDERNAALDKNN